MQTIYIGADHRGYRLKEILKESLRDEGYSINDLGNDHYDQSDDYPDFSIKVAEKTVAEKGVGIIICGSGIGANIAANKVKGARAGLCLNEKQARAGRNDDDINIVCLSADFVGDEENASICKTFLETVFGSDERYFRRVNKIKEYESKIC